MKLNLNSRFQDQPWHIKLWRYRWYLLIPLDIYKMWLYNRTSKPPDKSNYSLQDYSDIATSSAQIKMNWVYDFKDLTFRRPKTRKNKL